MTSPVATVGVALKWVPLRVDVDPLTGHVEPDQRSWGMSAADEAALEWALRLADRRGAEVLAVSAGDTPADDAVRAARAVGAHRAVRVTLEPDASSRRVAQALASVLADVPLIVCGDYSKDRGSGSVPSFLAAELGMGQVLGIVAIRDNEEQCVVDRRLDQGRRERLALTGPTVLSVEGATAQLRRAPLPGLLAAGRASVEVREVAGSTEPDRSPTVAVGPYRPPTRPVTPPDPSNGARGRILDLTGALTDRAPAARLDLEPKAAADAIIDQLRVWGYLQ